MTPVRVRHDQHDTPGCLIGPRLVLTVGEALPGDRIRVRVLDTEHSSRVVWRDGTTGAALIEADADIAPARVRWGSLPDMPRVPCSVLDVDQRIRTTVAPGPESATADTRDIDRSVSGAALACGDLILGVVLPGESSPVLTAADLLADHDVLRILSDHGLPDRAVPVDTSPAPAHAPDSVYTYVTDGTVDRIAGASPPTDPGEYARLVDHCLTITRAVPTEAMTAAGLADGYGPLHAAIDRVIATPDTPLEVSIALYAAASESMEHLVGDLCATAGLRLSASAEEPSSEVISDFVDAFDLAIAAYGEAGRAGVLSDTVADLKARMRAWLEFLPEQHGDGYRRIEAELLGDRSVEFMERGRFQAGVVVSGAAADSYRECVDRGMEDLRPLLAMCLGSRAVALIATGRLAEVGEAVTDALSVAEESPAGGDGRPDEDLVESFEQLPAILRTVGQEDVARRVEAWLGQVSGERPQTVQPQEGTQPQEGAHPLQELVSLVSRGHNELNTGRAEDAVRTYAEVIDGIRSLDRAGAVNRESNMYLALLGSSLHGHSLALRQAGDTEHRSGTFAEALRSVTEAVSVYRRVSADFHLRDFNLAKTLGAYASTLSSLGRLRQSLVPLEEACGLLASWKPSDMLLIPRARSLAELEVLRAQTLILLARDREVKEAARRALEPIGELPADAQAQAWEAQVRAVLDGRAGITDAEFDPLRAAERLQRSALRLLDGGHLESVIGVSDEALDLLDPVDESQCRALRAEFRSIRARAQEAAGTGRGPSGPGA